MEQDVLVYVAFNDALQAKWMAQAMNPCLYYVFRIS